MQKNPWVVLGDHPAALLTACVLSKKGYDVLCAPLMPSIGVMTSQQGQCIDLESNWILGVQTERGDAGVLSETLADLAVPQAALKWVHEGGGHLPQVVTPHHRLQWKVTDEELLVELTRERGSKIRPSNESLAEVLRFVEPRLRAHWGFSKSMHQGSTRGSELLAAIRQQNRIWGADNRVWTSSLSLGQSEMQPEWVEAMHGLRACLGFPLPSRFPTHLGWVSEIALLRSGKAFRGGITGYRDFLLRLAVHLGARVAQNEEECESILVEDGRVRGVRLRGQSTHAPVEGVVLGCAFSHAEAIFDRGHFSRRARAAQTIGLKPTAWKFTVALTVRSEGLSQGAGHRTIWYQHGAAPLEIEVSSPDEYQQVHSEDRLVFLRTELPFESKTLEPAYLNRMAARMFKQFSELHPFSEFHLVRVFPDFRLRGAVDVDALSSVFGFVSLEMIPDHLRVYDRMAGLGVRSPISNLWLANGESYPQLGSLASPVIAQEIAHQLARIAQSNDQRKSGRGSAIAAFQGAVRPFRSKENPSKSS